MSFCCPASHGCNDVQVDKGGWSPRGECIRRTVTRCVDPGLAALAEAWAVRREETPWWRPLKRLRYTRRYRRAVLTAYDAGIRPRMIQPPPMGVPPAPAHVRARAVELDDLDRRLQRDDMTADTRRALEHRRGQLANVLDPTYQPPAPPAHPLPNPPRPDWVIT